MFEALRVWRRVCVASLWLASLGSAHAEFDPPRGWLSGGFQPDATLYYSGFDIWRNGYGGYGGIESAVAAFGDDAVMLRLTTFDGTDVYQTRTQTFRTQTMSGALMVGGRVKRGTVEVKGFAGVDLQARLLLNPTLAWLERLHAGLRIAAEAWWEPSDMIIVSAAASMTTNSAARTARLAAGVRLLDLAWAGPELAMSGDIYSTQYRAGLHLSGLRVVGFEWSVAAGYVLDSFNRGGLYGRLGISTGSRDNLDGLVTP